MTTATAPVIDNRPAAVRIASALSLIAQAQMLINAATQELCPIRGMADEWDAAFPLHDKLRAYWYRIERKRDSLLKRGPIVVVDALTGQPIS